MQAIVNGLKAKHSNGDLVGDVEVYAKAGRFLIEFPELIRTQQAIDHAMTVLDQGIDRAKQLRREESPWNAGKKQIHAYYSAMDGSVQPYAVTLSEGWLRSQQAHTTIRMDARAPEQQHRDGVHL